MLIYFLFRLLAVSELRQAWERRSGEGHHDHADLDIRTKPCSYSSEAIRHIRLAFPSHWRRKIQRLRRKEARGGCTGFHSRPDSSAWFSLTPQRNTVISEPNKSLNNIIPSTNPTLYWGITFSGLVLGADGILGSGALAEQTWMTGSWDLWWTSNNQGRIYVQETRTWAVDSHTVADTTGIRKGP